MMRPTDGKMIAIKKIVTVPKGRGHATRGRVATWGSTRAVRARASKSRALIVISVGRNM